MKENVGFFDRVVRSVLGAGLVTIGATSLREAPVVGLVAAVAGALVLESAVTRVCPLNGALGIDTRSRQERLKDGHLEPGHKHLIIQRSRASA